MFKNLDDGKQALNDAIEEGKTYDKYRLVSAICHTDQDTFSPQNRALVA